MISINCFIIVVINLNHKIIKSILHQLKNNHIPLGWNSSWSLKNIILMIYDGAS
jgi:hypothetical protein